MHCNIVLFLKELNGIKYFTPLFLMQRYFFVNKVKDFLSKPYLLRHSVSHDAISGSEDLVLVYYHPSSPDSKIPGLIDRGQARNIVLYRNRWRERKTVCLDLKQ